MSFYIAPLASGSKGNTTLVSHGDTKILVDAGLSAREISARLLSCGVFPSELSGIAITHEHSDHIKGAVSFVKKFGTPIYVHEKIVERTNIFDEIDDYVHTVKDGAFQIGDVDIDCFRVPHDAVYTLGFSFKADNAKISLVTDIGLVTRPVYDNIYDSDILMLESNHDLEMLEHSSYPLYLIKRIRSSNGHLSNTECADTVSKLGGNLKQLILAHLSEENNKESIALDTARSKIKSSVKITAARQNEPVGIFAIESEKKNVTH